MNNEQRPYRLAFRLLRWFCPPELLEEIEGDLLQRYERDISAQSSDRLHATRSNPQRMDDRTRRANRRLLWNTIRFFRPGIILRNKFSPTPNTMLLQNLALAFRILSKNKVYALVNVFGLALGIAAFILMVEYVKFEESYDRFFAGHENIYRLQHNRFVEEKLLYQKAMSFPEVGIAMNETLPEVEAAGRLFPVSLNIEPVFTVRQSEGERSFPEPNVYLADTGFLDVIHLDFIHGDRSTALIGPNRIIVSASTALKFFSRTDVVGELVSDNLGNKEVLITGVFDDLPVNSHFEFDILASWFDVYGERSRFTWDGFYNYILLKEGTDSKQFSEKLDAFANTYMGAHYASQPGNYSRFELQPLADIHLHSHLDGEMKPNGNYTVTFTLSVIAGLIILIALINYINLNASRSISRLREVGVRKVIGSTRGQISIQFLCEGFITLIIAFFLAILTVAVAYPTFNNLFDTSISLVRWSEPLYWGWAVALLFNASLIAGFYPAFVLTRFKAYEALRNRSGKMSQSHSQMMFVGIQFAISLVLIIGTYLLMMQMNFMQTKNLGFDINQKLVIKMLPGYGDESDSTFVQKMTQLRHSLSAYSFVRSSTVSSGIPGRKNEWRGRTRLAGSDMIPIVANLTRVDKDFISTFNLNLIAGRNYFQDENNLNSVIINAETTRQLGFKKPEDAVGQKVTTFRDREVIGVVESFHETGLQESLSPSMFITGEGYTKFLTVSLKGELATEQLSSISRLWKTTFPDKPFEYFFLDDFFNRQYQTEQLAGKSVAWFAGIAIFLSCLGLLSLSIHTVHRKTKEIGIRKVLGASVLNVAYRLSRGFALPIILSAITAVPVSWYFANQWLARYAYHMEINWLHFAVPFALLTAIGITTTLTQTLKAANRNPVDSLRNE